MAALAVAAVLAVQYAAGLGLALRKAAAFSAAFWLTDAGLARAVSSSESAPSAQVRSTVSSAPPAPESSASANPGTTSHAPPAGTRIGSVKTVNFSLSSANLTADGVHISNKTDLKPDVNAYLRQGLPFALTDTDQPQVLIVHTHATEAFTQGDYGYYTTEDRTRNTDNTQNVVQVGEVMARVLNEAGIVTINDATQHDHPYYNGAYTRSAETIRRYLKQYPSIKVVIDGHRDAIGTEEEKLKPTATVDGRKAAQVMVLAGCQTGAVEGYPDWEENFRFCLQLQKRLEADYPGLARPLCLKAVKYNFDLLNGSILLEIGTDANTLAEAEWTAELVGRALVKVLKPQ